MTSHTAFSGRLHVAVDCHLACLLLMLARLPPGAPEHHKHARPPGARTCGEAVHGPRVCPVPLEHRWVWVGFWRCLLDVWVFIVSTGWQQPIFQAKKKMTIINPRFLVLSFDLVGLSLVLGN